MSTCQIVEISHVLFKFDFRLILNLRKIQILLQFNCFKELTFNYNIGLGRN
jgi:hypothetical protein